MPLVVYFDEVGNPTLDDSDKDFPVFAISMFICHTDDYVHEIVPNINALKFKYFRHEAVVLHSRDIRKSLGDFSILRDPSVRAEFMTDLSDVMASSTYRLLAVAIRKDRLIRRYVYPENPYDLALLFVMERLVSVLEGHGQTEVTIIAERRGRNEDRDLHAAFQRIITRGTGYVELPRFQRIAWNLRFLPKTMNTIGTQMADLAAYPIARRVLDPTKPNGPYDIVRPKLARQLKIFP
ncbi:MAG: DUF3800 domain-containing protein [Acidobacteria bacterium]|nr:DUF3800 domain-containing protein [Acidobacteriota bacterium]